MLKLKRYLIPIHRWIGLAATAWLFLLAVTGTLLSIYDPLDAALNSDLMTAASEGERLSLESLSDIVEKTYVGARISSINLSQAEDSTVAFRLTPKTQESNVPDGLDVYVNPTTGEVLGERVFGAVHFDSAHIMGLIYTFHMNMYLGEGMAWFLGLVAVFWIAMMIAGMGLALPKLKYWRKSFTIQKRVKGLAYYFQFHRAAGLWFAPFFIVFAISGLSFNWGDSLANAVSLFSPVTPFYDAPSLSKPIDKPAVSLNEAISIAKRHTSDQPIDEIAMLINKGLYEFSSHDPRDLTAAHGERYTYVDMMDGTIVYDKHPNSGTGGDIFMAWQYPLHSGQVLGWPGRVLVMTAGMALTLMTATGLYLWFKRRRLRQR